MAKKRHKQYDQDQASDDGMPAAPATAPIVEDSDDGSTAEAEDELGVEDESDADFGS